MLVRQSISARRRKSSLTHLKVESDPVFVWQQVTVGLLALLIWPIAGGDAALAVLAAGAFILLFWHLAQLDALTRWASGELEESVPEGRGTWALAYAALYRRVRLRSARQRDLRLALDRFVSGAEALHEGVVVLDVANRIQWSNPRAQTHLGVALRQDAGAPIVNIVRQPAFVQYLASGDFSEPVIIDSQREAGMTPYEIMLSESQERMLLVVHQGAEERATKIYEKWGLDCVVAGTITDSGPRHHAPRSGGAPAARLHRQCLARAQDATYGADWISGNARRHAARGEAARSISLTHDRAGAEYAAPGR